jgi:hypothetical protein
MTTSTERPDDAGDHLHDLPGEQARRQSGGRFCLPRPVTGAAEGIALAIESSERGKGGAPWRRIDVIR